MPLPVADARLAAVRAAAGLHAEAAQSGDLIAIHRANMAFHRWFFGLCDNPYIEESIRLHDWLSFPARAYAITDQSALSRACEEHGQMVTAIERCDREALLELALGHMLQARRIYEGKYLSR